MCRIVLSFAFVFLLSPLSSALASPQGTTVASFKLNSVSGETWSLDDCKDKKAIVVVFIGTYCPINNSYMPRLVEITKEYEGKGVQFVAINANEGDSTETIAKHAKKHGLTFPVLRDEKQRVASLFGAVRHPTAYVLDAKHAIRYEGRIDDQFGIGYQRPQATRRDLGQAIEEVLAGKAVTVASTPVEGCFNTKRSAARATEASLTYAKDISRIVQNRCQECHRPGQIGPMPLMSYEDVSAWSQMIREVVHEGRMPPWHADPKHGAFRNDRRLGKDDTTKLLAWIDAGCPKGDDKDLPEPKKYVEGWMLGKPDAVFTMPQEFTVPAKAPKGGIPYKYVMIPTKFTEDKWVEAIEAKPGNNAIVHHIIVYLFIDGKRSPNMGDGIGNGMLVAYAPGDLGSVFPPGAAKKIPKGATLVLQMHYTPNGTEHVDRSSIAMRFAKETPKVEIKTRAITQQKFIIPPHADNHRVTSKTSFDKDVVLYSLSPHMHLRGKSFDYVATFPDGKKEILLSVPRYDFGWQSNYLLENPRFLPAGTKIECTAHFDNSEKNLNNPNPASLVFWGEQTWQEMMIGFVDYALADAVEVKK